ncbi:MAG: hypothetical protein LCH52_03855 [Bacteroidetes bacterium]|nr:hypothetical protein [Bacteroidota bacterium]
MKYNEIEITKQDMKVIFKISLQTIEKLIQTNSDFPKIQPTKKYNLLECIHFFQKNGTTKANTTTDAKLRLLELQSKKLELSIREQENELVEIDHIKDTIQKITQKIKQTLEQLPRKISKKTDNRSEMEIEVIAKDIIAVEIEKLLRDIDNVQGK